MKEVNLFGIYFAPFAAYVMWAFLLFLPIRLWFDRVGIQRWFWHRSLLDTATYVILLSLIGLLF
jgi:hypothetical protein